MRYFEYVIKNNELRKGYDYYLQFSGNPHLHLYKHIKALYAGFGQNKHFAISDNTVIEAMIKFENDNIKFYNQYL